MYKETRHVESNTINEDLNGNPWKRYINVLGTTDNSRQNCDGSYSSIEVGSDHTAISVVKHTQHQAIYSWTLDGTVKNIA